MSSGDNPNDGRLEVQPPPVARGVIIVPLLVRWLNERGQGGSSAGVEPLLWQRYEFGLRKYGQPLMSGDGRRSASDAIEELLDALCYVVAAHIKDEDLERVRRLHALLGELLTHEAGVEVRHLADAQADMLGIRARV